MLKVASSVVVAGLLCHVCMAQQALSPITATPGSSLSPVNTTVPGVTIAATVTRTSGNKETIGSGALKASADGSTSEQWTFSDGTTTFSGGVPELGRGCTSTTSQGVSAPDTTASCYRALPWFAPWLGDPLSVSGALLKLPVTSTGGVEYRFAIPADLGGGKRLQARANSIAALSSITLYPDPSTGLPGKATFSEPATNSPALLQNTVTYGDYRLEGVLMMPHHITRAVQGTTVLDLQITAVALN